MKHIFDTYKLYLLSLGYENDPVVPWLLQNKNIGIDPPLLRDMQVLGYLESALKKYPPYMLGLLEPLAFVSCGAIRTLDNGEIIRYGGISIRDSVLGWDNTNLLLVANPNEDSVHHELWHALNDGSCDADFESVNLEFGLAYHPELTYKQISRCGGYPIGFASCYGAWTVNEDKATVAEKLMVGDRRFWGSLETDRALSQKSEVIIAKFAEISGGEMDLLAFFQKIRDGEFTPDYFGWPSYR